jgi:peroxiredoxin Q/BCP
MVKEGDKAPDFSLPGIDQGGTERVFSLADYRGQKVILYFYPRDNTPGCTTEACDFRDNLHKLKKAGAVVIGVSPDSVASHMKFMDKQGLVFTLLSDTERKVATAYGAYGEKKMYGKTTMGIIRSTFFIDEDGVIKKLWRKVKVAGHVDVVLSSL